MFPCMIHSGMPFWSINPICTCSNVRTGTCYSIGEVIEKDKILQEKSIQMFEKINCSIKMNKRKN